MIIINKRLALTTEGRMIYCEDSEESMGKICYTHLAHQNNEENPVEFINRVKLPEFFDNTSKIKYTSLHIKTLKLLVKELFPEDKELTKRINIHDTDKISMLEKGIHPKDASLIHRNTQSHHPESETLDLSKTGIKEMILDFESAGFTKPDKPLNAYDTIHKYYPQLIEDFTPILEEYNMNHSYLVSEKYPELYNKIQKVS